MRKRIISFLLVLIVAITFMPAEASAASGKVKMTAYDKVLKKGNVLYCAGAEGIYKVGVDNAGKLTSAQLLYREESMGTYSYFYGMKLKGKYLYAQSMTEGTSFGLCRIHVKTGKYRHLASVNDKGSVEYAIKGKKIYFKGQDSKKGKVMKLNGKSKKKTSTKPKMIHKETNANGYTVIIGEKELPDDEYLAITYLRTPAGTYTLGSHIE